MGAVLLLLSPPPSVTDSMTAFCQTFSLMALVLAAFGNFGRINRADHHLLIRIFSVRCWAFEFIWSTKFRINCQRSGWLRTSWHQHGGPWGSSTWHLTPMKCGACTVETALKSGHCSYILIIMHVVDDNHSYHESHCAPRLELSVLRDE